MLGFCPNDSLKDSAMIGNIETDNWIDQDQIIFISQFYGEDGSGIRNQQLPFKSKVYG